MRMKFSDTAPAPLTLPPPAPPAVTLTIWAPKAVGSATSMPSMLTDDSFFTRL